MKYNDLAGNNYEKIDRSLVKAPVVELTEKAKEELKLILENDHTLEGKWLRILVSGKGCDGFDYSVGFTEFQKDDFQTLINLKTEKETYILMDPFTAYYLQNSNIDYVQDFQNDLEGFVVKNLNQDEFTGKFWKTGPEKTPPLIKQT
ncbi:MAG: hypothetical protein KC493_01365 [Bacteriovoracaceae bacterium]|nr:hypothetical protein [Bacteriovoracaceae bacterium]